MPVDNWDEFRTAYQVARLGTVSAAAEALGVHHATVIRHVDALEARLGVKLFQRHARGYTPTEAGEDLLRVAAATEDQLTQLVGRMRGRQGDIEGDVIVTTVVGIADLIAPALVRLQRDYPAIHVKFVSDQRLFRLDYGEAHVAIRAGSRPEDLDNVVQRLGDLRVRLVATKGYAKANGLPKDQSEFAGHRFVGTIEGGRAPFARWFDANVPSEAVVFRASEFAVLEIAVREGLGIGFMSVRNMSDDFVEVIPEQENWSAPLWLVTHVDLHRTAKVQAVLRYLKDGAKDWVVE